MAHRTSNIPGGHRVTVANKYDKERSATDYDLNKYATEVVSIVDHGRDGSSHSHKPIHGILGVSKGDRISDNKGGSS